MEDYMKDLQIIASQPLLEFLTHVHYNSNMPTKPHA